MVTISTIQFKPEHGRPHKNREAILEICSGRDEAGTGIFILPEMCLTGYIWTERDDLLCLAECAAGESYMAFSELCVKNGAYLAYGFAELDPVNSLLYNSQNLIGPDGSLLATYRKTYLYDLDYTWAEPGDSGFIAVDTSIGRIGLGICMDLNYDDFVDFHKYNNTDWLLFSTNWLEQGIDVHDYWLNRFNGYRGTAFMANTFGFEFNIEFCGRSSVYENGRFIVRGPKNNRTIIKTSHIARK